MHSFLKRYPVEVCHNKVDTHQFKPSPSNFRKIHHIEDKFIILGVATAWQKCKGLYDFVELANQLDDSYQVVMVGLKKKQLTMISEKIIGIERTNDVRELAEIYSEADVFVNPTIEDNFPNVNIEYYNNFNLLLKNGFEKMGIFNHILYSDLSKYKWFSNRFKSNDNTKGKSLKSIIGRNLRLLHFE